jgi:polyphosphate kinase
MIRRIEVAWPILDAQMQTRILQECIVPYLSDNEDAWVLTAGGEYQQLSAFSTSTHSAQKQLINQYAGN